MTAGLLRLMPGPATEVALRGAYLAHRLHGRGSPAAPLVYGSFVSSLDGRIALRDPQTGAGRLPAGLTSANDLRLFLELQAQADTLVTTAGYLRDLAAGRLDDVLQVGLREGAEDLARWRAAAGLPPQPTIVVVSASLEFPMPDSPTRHGQRVLIATGATAPAERVARWRDAGWEVIVAGAGASVEGAPLVRALGARGLRSLYLLGGPRLLDVMLRDGVLAWLYVTVAHRLIGGEAFDSMAAGPELGALGRLRLDELYYDSTAPEGSGQWFTRFAPLREAP